MPQWVLQVGLLLLVCLGAGAAEDKPWTPPAVRLPARDGHPLVACTTAELERLRQAWQAQGSEHDVVAALVRQVAAAMPQPLSFPPRGGQHNQWYQCDTCQTALQTVDETHHKCPLCAKVYSGPPYDDVLFTARHSQLLRTMHDAAWAYAITGNATYAEFASRILLGYAERYLQYPYHANTRTNPLWAWVSGGRLFEQTLSEAVALSREIGPAYDLIHDWPGLKPDDHTRVRDGLILPMLTNIDKYKAGVVNWQSWHNAAMFIGGAVIGQQEWLHKAVYGGAADSVVDRTISWLENVRERSLKSAGNGLLFQLGNSVTPDGMWYEQSWGYHFYALQALVTLVEAARRTDADFWPHPSLKKMFLLPVYYTMPNGELPRFGDDTGAAAGGRPDLLEPAYAAYKAPVLLSLLSPHPTWDSVLQGRDTTVAAARPALASMLFPAAGHAILRTPGPAGLVTAVAFGPAGGYHAHLDKLSFVFFGYGQELGVDPGRAQSQAYRLPIHREWYKATVSHNTVLVDGQSQANAAGRLLLFGKTPDCAAVAASCRDAYPGVRHDRLLVQTPEWLLVLDDLEADRDCRFDWLYHNRGQRAVCPAATGKADLHALAGSQHIQNAIDGTTYGPVTVSFEGGKAGIVLAMARAPGTRVTVGDGVGASVTDRVPLVLVSRQGRTARFAAVLQPSAGTAAPAAADIQCTATDGQLTVIVTAPGPAPCEVRWCGGDRVTVVQQGREILAASGPPPAAPAKQ